MTNKSNALPSQAIDFPMENRVHIAGVTGSSPVSPTIFSRQLLRTIPTLTGPLS